MNYCRTHELPSLDQRTSAKDGTCKIVVGCRGEDAKVKKVKKEKGQ